MAYHHVIYLYGSAYHLSLLDANAKTFRLGTTNASLKLKGIDGESFSCGSYDLIRLTALNLTSFSNCCFIEK